MTTLGIVSGLLAAVIGATVAGKLWPRIPLPIWQVISGIILWLLPFTFNFVFQPEVFLICVIAPLLFGEAQRVSRKELWELRRPVILLALGLVLVTVFAGGYFIHQLIPGMTYPAAFALAAIISPTDLIAVQSMTKGMKLPGNLTSILEGESLLNDAAGVVSFKVAIAVAMTGEFSAKEAMSQFLFTSIGGILGGLVLGLLFVHLRLFLQDKGLEELPMVVVIQLVTPLCIFYVTEELGVSGILAVVAAGIVHGMERERLGRSSTKLRVVTDNSWLVLEYLLNGIVFVLLGYLLPLVFGEIIQKMPGTAPRALLVIFAVTVILISVRFLWVFLWHSQFIRKKKGSLERMAARHMGFEKKEELADGGISRGKYSLITAFCGAHGTFTLATALSIPYVLPSGEPFPMRDVILVSASGVVLLSLLLAAVTLPRLLDEEPEAQGMAAVEANKFILSRAIEELEQEKKQTANLVAHYLNEQLAELEQGGRRPDRRTIKALVRGANKAALAELVGRIRDGRVSDQLQQMMAQYHKKSGQMIHMNQWNQYLSLRKLLRIFHIRGKRGSLALGENVRAALAGDAALRKELHDLRKAASQTSIDWIKTQMNSENRREALTAIQYYSVALNWTDLAMKRDEEFRTSLNKYRKQAFQIQRDAVRQLRDEERITEQTAKDLLESLLYEEMLEINS